MQLIQIMNQQEAITWERQIGSAANELRRLLAEGYEREAWRVLGYSSWSECLRNLADKHGFSERHVLRLHSANETEKLLTHGSVEQNIDNIGQIPERILRPLSRLESDDDKRQVWQLANETAPNGKLTGTHVESVVEQFLADEDLEDDDLLLNFDDPLINEWFEEELENVDRRDWSDDAKMEYAADRTQERVEEFKKSEKAKSYITLTEWNNGQRWQGEQSSNKMNEVNENIEWAGWSWNPVTGCLHNCAYCYARDIANRFYTQKFEPSFIPERLSQPANTKIPNPRWSNDIGYKNIFTCSMADLFGKWVPQEWIEAVLETINHNPQWTFLLLTKFPVRMAEFSYPQNVWLGTSVDYQWAVERAEKAFTKIKASGFNGICWLSCEPMMERLTFSSLEMFDWVVMGGSSKSTQTPEYKPPFEDILHLHNQARAAGCKIYQKTNLIPGMSDEQRIREYPTK